MFHAEVDPHWLAAQVEPVLAVARQALAVARQALAVARQLAHGVQTLNGHVQQLVDGVGRVARLLQDYLAARQLEDQRALAARCVPMGLLVMAAGLLWSSAVVGRLPEVGRICAIRVAAAAPRPSSLFGAASALLRPDRLLRSALAWPLCLAEQLGLYTAGVALLGYAALGLARHGAAPAVGGGAAWVVDIPLRLGVFVAVAGGHVLHCLGGAWTVWLVLWWAWCASLALLHAAVHSRARLALLALLVAIVLPYFAAVVPFYAWSVSHHGALAKRMAAMLHGVLSLLAPLLPRPAAALFSH